MSYCQCRRHGDYMLNTERFFTSKRMSCICRMVGVSMNLSKLGIFTVTFRSGRWFHKRRHCSMSHGIIAVGILLTIVAVLQPDAPLRCLMLNKLDFRHIGCSILVALSQT